MALPIVLAFTIIMTLILIWTKTLLPRSGTSGELSDERANITAYKIRPSTHALYAEIAYTAMFAVITFWFRGWVYMIFTIPFIIVGGICLLTHFAKAEVMGEHIRTYGLRPKAFTFSDIERIEASKRKGYLSIKVFLKNNGYSARPDLKLKNTDDNIDLFIAKVRGAKIPFEEPVTATKAKKQFKKLTIPRLRKAKISASTEVITKKGDRS